MWLRLTDANNKPVMVNSDNVIWFGVQPGSERTELRCTYYGGDRNIALIVNETMDDIIALLADHEATVA